MSLIELADVSHTFSGSRKSLPVFEGVNLLVNTGEFVSLLGPSGCGKSTLLRLMGGLLSPSKGTIQFERAVEKAFVFQEPRLLPWRTCLENTLLPLELRRGRAGPESRKLALDRLRLLGLAQAQDLFPHQLSGGMRMRNSLARSLMLDPELLLLDEPFAALDETTRFRLQNEFRDLYESKRWTVVFVTHSIEEACFLSSRVLLYSKIQKAWLSLPSRLPVRRGAGLRESVEFFEEVKTLRARFQAECLQ